MLLENAQDVGDLFAVTRCGPTPADDDPLADIGRCEPDLKPEAHAGHPPISGTGRAAGRQDRRAGNLGPGYGVIEVAPSRRLPDLRPRCRLRIRVRARCRCRLVTQLAA
jgi:hypothetical protein